MRTILLVWTCLLLSSVQAMGPGKGKLEQLTEYEKLLLLNDHRTVQQITNLIVKVQEIDNNIRQLNTTRQKSETAIQQLIKSNLMPAHLQHTAHQYANVRQTKLEGFRQEISMIPQVPVGLILVLAAHEELIVFEQEYCRCLANLLAQAQQSIKKTE